jgi:hypothetical protein
MSMPCGHTANALVAVDAAALRPRILAAARLGARDVVRDGEALVVGQRALEAGVRAEVAAELVAEPRQVEKPDEREDAGDEVRRAACRAGPHRCGAGEVAAEGAGHHDRDERDHRPLEALPPHLLERPRRLVELHALGARSLDPMLERPHQ